MNRWVLRSGALASSTVAVCGFIDVSALGLSESATTPSPLDPASPEAQAEDAATPTAKPSIQTAPDAFMPDALLSEVLGIQSRQLPNAIEETYDELLQQAQDMASHNRFTEALTTAAGIPKNSRHYDLAQQLQEDWSQELLQRAVAQCQQGQMTEAISLLKLVPSTSPQHQRATELQGRWHRQASLLNRAIAAKQAGDWQAVAQALKPLEGTPVYQSAPVQTLLQRSIQESYGSNRALLQFTAMAGGDRATAMSMPTVGSPMPTISASSAELPIDLAQAMTWARPTTQVALASPGTKSFETSLEMSSKRLPTPPVQTPLQISKQLMPPSEDAPISNPLLKSSIAPPEAVMP
jgi:hypothetical protein